MLITKTTYLDYLYCPKNVWLKFHKPELLENFKLSEFEKHIIEQGNEVDAAARNLFEGGIEVTATGEDATHDTVRFMASRVPTIFQATFIADGFMARNDMLSYNEDKGGWDLYEVKGTNRLKENGTDHNHIDDVAFQVSVLNRSKVPLGRYFIIHLNKEYVRQGSLDIMELFKMEDVTERVLERLLETERQMEDAKKYLTQKDEPKEGCECVWRGRSKHCATFPHNHPRVSEYSVHDLTRFGGKKLKTLVENGIYDLNEIPEDFELTENQKNQVWAHKYQRPIINILEIKRELEALKFPLYFFDYEAVGPAIPVFDGYGPYKRIPFQFSLHILREPDGKLEHVEYLHSDLTDPSENVAVELKKHIKGGTAIAWHKPYEAGVNREIGMRLPMYAKFFEDINNSLYDLRDIFQNQHYVHDGFKGRTSIKKVLPVLVPELRYDTLEIQEGGAAVDAWWKMVSPQTMPEEAENIAKNLKIYCGQDTYAMYAIWKHLMEISLG